MARTRPQPQGRNLTESVEVLGVGIDPVRAGELGERILSLVRTDRSAAGPALVLNVNAHGLNLARREKGLKKLLDSADVVFADGFGVLLAARMVGGYLPERITYADWAWDLAHLAESEGLSVFLLGGRPGVARRAAGNLLEAHPELRVSGTHHGYFDRRTDGLENRRVIEAIEAAAPDLLLVGLGMPVQEEWLLENRRELGAKVAFNCGAAFDYLSGELVRGPRFLTDNGFEWLARLLVEPGRLWRRYLLGNPVFLARAVRQAVISRARAGRNPA
ncbi:WecB/TagA/CpsF family glycosyltransferase [Rubrobacter indicoceani]|uniref:WecB/TagA/CpsF family glycosyltransferase n=1 Tax=Rubrobacter indicoceani TaxID=2051957 RepID=UPI000E5C54FA|nr:WecB/TagA/CpsF family glycosyltransferase [Rubrobacter indicoceani]